MNSTRLQAKIFPLIILLTVFFSWTILANLQPVQAQTPAVDWPMAGANPERSSWTPETLPGNIKTLWVKPLAPHVPQHTQVIAAEGKVFVSTTKGLYAFDAATGNYIWVYPTELPLGHSPTYNSGILYVGGMDRRMHAVNAATGQGIWTYLAEGGFSTNPVVINDKVFAGNRDGAFYAINAGDGSLAWKYQTDNQILQSAAYKDGVLYFASNDAYAYALNAADGSLVWKSANKLASMGQYVWWPVIYQDYVIFTRTPFEDGLNGAQSLAIFPGTNNSNLVPGVLGTEPGNWPTGQATLNVATNPSGPMSIPNYFETYPHRRSAVFLNRTSGQEQQFDIDNDGIIDAAPISTLGDAGTRYPPIVSGFDNVLYFRTVNRNQNASFSSATLAGWQVGTPILSLPYSNMTGQSAGMPSDEPSGISAGGNKIFWNHCCDRFVGAVDVSQPNTDFFSRLDDANRQWRYITSPGLPFYTPPTNIGMPVNYYQEAVKFFFDPPYPAIFWNENNKVGPAIYQGRLYVIMGNALVTFAADGAGSTAPILPSAPQVTSQNGASTFTPAYLTSRLETEVSKILAADHLKPSFMFAGGISGLVKNKYDEYMMDYWHNPSDIQVTLIRALPHLSPTLQDQVKTYLQTEFASYSPLAYNHIGWTSGAQRDTWEYPPTDAKMFTTSFGPMPYGNFSGWSTPPHNIYAVWKYAQAGLGDPVTLFSQLQNRLKPSITQVKANLTDSYLAGFPHVHNAYIAGYIGYIELAKMAGLTVEQYQPYQNELDRLLALRVANLTTFPIPPSPYGADHSYFDTVITIWNFMYLTPELADYLSVNAQSNVESIISTYQAIAPNWMIAHNGETQGESAFVPYQQTHSLFQALAMIKNAPREELAKYLDTPITPIGDLFYIDNLVSVLESTPSTPPPTYKGDSNGDNNVDQTDYEVWAQNYNTVTAEGVAAGDFNLDSKVDGLDYVIWFNTVTI